MIIFISIFSIILSILLILFLVGYDKLFTYENYKKLVKNNTTNVTYERFLQVVKNINLLFALNISNYTVILFEETSKDFELVLRIKELYFAVNEKGLIYLFDEEEMTSKKVNVINKAVKECKVK